MRRQTAAGRKGGWVRGDGRQRPSSSTGPAKGTSVHGVAEGQPAGHRAVGPWSSMEVAQVLGTWRTWWEAGCLVDSENT